MKSKNTETAVITLLGFIKTRIAKWMGFQCKLEDVSWKLMQTSAWLKIQIAVDNLQTFLVGSSTDENLCGRRWFYMIDEIRDHKAFEPNHDTPEYKEWFDKLIKLKVDKEMAHFEMLYHRTGRPQYSWSRDDMGEHHIAALPKWWFDGTKAKRKLREINDK